MLLNLRRMVGNGQTARKRPLTAACLFAGMGGFCAGLQQANIKTLWANEVDEFAVATFRANYPKVRMLHKSVADLSVKGDNLAPVDILTAGFPCQSFSQAGQRRGFKDERGQFFFDIPRLLNEFGENRPPIVLLENVPYLKTGAKGAWLERVICEMRFAGYWFSRHNCHILNTMKMTDLPQRRERIYMAALSTDAFTCNEFRFPGINGAPQDLSRFVNKAKKMPGDHYLPEDNRYYEVIATKSGEGDTKSIYQLRRYYARENKRECPPLTANMGGGGHNVPFVRDRWGIRRLTVRECASLQGFDDNYRLPASVPPREQYRQIGNAVSVPIIKKLGRECVRILRTERS